MRSADRVANPGCYATGAIALLRPLIEAGLLSPDAAPRRAELVRQGAEVSARYLPEQVIPQWHELLDRLPPGR